MKNGSSSINEMKQKRTERVRRVSAAECAPGNQPTSGKQSSGNNSRKKGKRNERAVRRVSRDCLRLNEKVCAQQNVTLKRMPVSHVDLTARLAAPVTSRLVRLSVCHWRDRTLLETEPLLSPSRQNLRVNLRAMG